MQRTTLFLLSLIISFASYSQEKATDIYDMSLEELLESEISGVSRYKQESSEIPNSITVINHQQIIDRGYFDLSDLLKDVQGFDISENANRFGAFYSLRGVAGNDRFLVLINGHKLNPVTGTFLSIGNSISIRHAERVEIIYGPASAAYGADAFSGIINIIFSEKEDQNKYSGSAYANYGSMNTMDFGAQGSAKITDDLSFYLSARLYKSDGFDAINDEATYDIIKNYNESLKSDSKQPIDNNNIYFKLKYKNSSLNFYRQQFDQGNATGMDPSLYVYDQTNRWKTSTNIIWYNYKKQFDNNGELVFDLRYTNHVQDPNTVFHKWKSKGVVGPTFKQYMTGLDNTVHGLVTYNQKIREKLQFIVGIDNEYTQSIPPYANDEVLGTSSKYEGDNATRIKDELTIEENRFSIFSQITYSPIEQINLVIGARFDNSTRYGSVLNPRFGFVISPLNDTKINFTYGRAFQAPSLFYQYEQFGIPTLVMLSTEEVKAIDPNWKLENQIVNSYEVSFNQYIGKNYKIRVGGYYNQLTNLIERKLFASAPDNTVYNKYFGTQTSGLRNENIGSQDIMGVDVTFNAKIAKNFLLYSYYSFTDGKSKIEGIDETGIARISEHKAWLGVTAKNLFGYVTISPRFRWVSDPYNANTTLFADNSQSGYHSLDVALSVNNISKYFRVYANFFNVLDDKTSHGGLYGQGGVYTATIPQPGFTFKAGIEILLNQ